MENKSQQASDMDFRDASTPGTGAVLSANVPADKLLALMNASDEMMQSIFRRDRKATLDTVVRAIPSHNPKRRTGTGSC